ncbi:MAG: hypothetical protein ACYC0V_01420 [Armatimonadota bacterium]
MGSGCLFSFIFAFGGLIVFALLAPILFRGQDMRMVGQMASPIIVIVFGPIGFAFGFLRHKRKQP